MLIFGDMANTFSKINIHLVFAVKNRESLLPHEYLPQIHAYIAQTLRNLGHVPIIVGGIEDHVHILFSYNINQTIPEMVRTVKTAVTNFINSHGMLNYRFSWQRGYACFSYSQSQLPAVINYIKNQEAHHNRHGFNDECRRLLDIFDVKYDPKYLFVD